MSARETLLEVFEMLEEKRWGTCVDCPRPDGKTHPKECVNTMRYDHWLAPHGSSLMLELRDLIAPELAKSVDTQ